MASKRRIRRNMCDGKKRHTDKNAAWAHARHARNHGKPYRCKFCRGYHIGH